MNTSGKIFFNSEVIEQCGKADYPLLLRGNYVYAAVNTVGHKPLYLKRHLDFAIGTYRRLYNRRPVLDMSQIASRIPELLFENRLPRGCNMVTVYLMPPGEESGPGKPDIIISAGLPTIYDGYELLTIRPKAVVTNYDMPFSGHRTAVSLTASEYMAGFAAHSGAGLSLRSNRAGNLVSAGDYPVFALKNGKIITPAAESGAGNNVEKELMTWALEREGMTVEEGDIPVAELGSVDELMVFGPYGIQSVLSCGEAYFYSTTALALEKHLKVITDEGLYIPEN